MLVYSRFTIVEALARKQKHRRQAAKTRPRANDADDIDNAPVDRASATQSPPAAQGEVTHHLYSPSSDPEASRDAAINEQLVHEGLVEFFKNGIGSQSWSRFDRLSETRMCYIGTSLSNLAQLVHEERRADNTPLHYPIPQIRHMDTRCPVLDLRMGQNLNLLPDRDVRDALVVSKVVLYAIPEHYYPKSCLTFLICYFNLYYSLYIDILCSVANITIFRTHFLMI